MENTAIQSTKHSQRRKLNQANPIFHQKNKNKMNTKNTLINNNSLKILNRSLKADQMSEWVGSSRCFVGFALLNL